ncbi:MAG: hypothetical protein AAF657_09450 [Acidobacteriota bacterium]
MNTPAHAIVSLLALGRKDQPETGWPLVAGALLPDAPIVVFYAYQKIRGRTEEWIWSEGYFLEAWQGFFDLFNSLPLILIGLLAAHQLQRPRLQALFASMALHVLGDLPLHHDDGHRHFYPFSDWRYASPVSYWDPQHYGLIVAPLETLLVIVGGLFLLRRYESPKARWLIGSVVAIYAAYWIYVVTVWM